MHFCFPQIDGFDVPAAIERMLGRPDWWMQTVDRFLEHFSDWEAEWHKAAGRPVSERRCVHALRSAAANIGASELAEHAGRLEAALHVGSRAEDIERLRGALGLCFRQACVRLAEWRAMMGAGPGSES